MGSTVAATTWFMINDEEIERAISGVQVFESRATVDGLKIFQEPLGFERKAVQAGFARKDKSATERIPGARRKTLFVRIMAQQRPVTASQTCTDPSSLALASQLPSGATATAFTQRVWPERPGAVLLVSERRPGPVRPV